MLWFGNSEGTCLVVKSATKKRLIEIGVTEENAHKLARNRNMTNIKTMTIEQIAVCLGKSTEDEAVTAVMDGLAKLRRGGVKNHFSNTVPKNVLEMDIEMPRGDITERMQQHLKLIEKSKIVNPRYALLNCRMAAEAILIQLHQNMVGHENVKNIIALGEVYTKKLGLLEFFDPLQLSSIDFINRATSQYLHFNFNEPKLRNNLIDRVVDELHYLIDTIMPEEISKLEINSKSDWKVVLESELERIQTPANRLFSKENLKILRAKHSAGVYRTTAEGSPSWVYVRRIEELLKLSDEELISEEKRLLKSLLVAYYEAFGGENYSKDYSSFSKGDMKRIFLEGGWPCSANWLLQNKNGNPSNYLIRPMTASEWRKVRREGLQPSKVGYRLAHDWKFIYL